MRPEGSCQRKIPVTTSEIETATFRLVAQCLSQMAPPRASGLVVTSDFEHCGWTCRLAHLQKAKHQVGTNVKATTREEQIRGTAYIIIRQSFSNTNTLVFVGVSFDQYVRLNTVQL